jgi:hypothetical protein
MADVFISYASEDRSRIQPLVEALRTTGLDVWWDRHIGQGQNFGRVIEQALEEASCVVAAWTSASVESEWVCNEASEARKLEKLVPVLLDEVEVPLEFRHLHMGSLVGWTGDPAAPAFQELLASVRRFADAKTTRPTPIASASRLNSVAANPMRFVMPLALLLGGIGLLLIGLKQVGLLGNTESNTTESSATETSAAAVGTPAQSAPREVVAEDRAEVTPSPAEPKAADLPLADANLLLPENGGKILQADNQSWQILMGSDPTYASLLVNGFAVFELGSGKGARFDTFAAYVAATNDYNVKELAVLTSDESPNGPFRPVARVTVPNFRDMQNPFHEFPVGPASARYVKVQVVSVYNGSTYGSVGSLKLLNRRSGSR